jgi:hypothetical protein
MTRHKRKIVFSIGAVAFALLVLFSGDGNGFSFTDKIKSPVSTFGIEPNSQEDIPSQQEKEPTYLSIFKLIVNCNPFKQKRVQ